MRLKARFLVSLLGIPFLTFGSSQVIAAAAEFPNRTVRLIVPFQPGGGTDIVARLLAPKLSEAWKHNVVVDNREGGGSTIGTSLAARANPDGHVRDQPEPS
jgi:tripartite-type tricarboxylate transporter receptor subunit TctC